MKVLVWGKRTFDLGEGFDSEELVSAWMKEAPYRCHTVRSNLSSCFPIFFFFLINSVFKVSVFVLLFSLYM